MKGKKVDWSGKTQGNLTVVRDIGKDCYGSRLWLCVCSCGTEVVKSSNVLKQGVKSCSAKCGVGESNRNRTKHGQATRDKGTTKVYMTWLSLRDRCTNPNCAAYPRYGGRGITVCRRWNSFENFYADVGEPPTPKHTLDRINNNKGYTPSNVRWATRKEQANNRNRNVWVKYEGKRMTWAQWAEHLGISYTCLMTRVRDKTDLKEILVKGNKKLGRPKKVHV